ncbi:bifunctional 4-hydroxy-2-oxoglutarate aldolase/2-dehydro-3-deoxy-phosphogluconate aldolase [Endozoicomonas ascidiicola]|uniref:bifunctional 4-hydroxy-2-oxoglutarate aldolase/2-dehydro-3-deoxy-phosphogluconate aldolase n=1 Tax=Endozoicomonas ascidiicola TaxID=1698521 RepID=UPI00082CCEC0|nr:bifunctional 4-hydroxy-2-oxoglutarate aldolase/2-dehydro-3-deoxy-phosphogluconate aldolase [Endozoicomonas ascidiicola]
MNSLDVLLQAKPVMPVMVIDHIDQATPLASALHKGGINVFEITLRSECALDAITLIKKELPNCLVGAGTVLNPEQLKQAIEAGSDFALSPGLTAGLLEFAGKTEMPFIPGVASPGDVMLALSYGINAMKLFPATQLGGEGMLKALYGPFPEVMFCPTGGISADNYRSFLSLPNVACVGASWIAPAALAREEKWDEITFLAKAAVDNA